MSNTQSLTCQNCGAALAVAAEVRFVTCNYCHSQLEIVRNESSTHTQLLQSLDRRSVEIAGNIEVIKLQNALEQLDREWMMQRDTFMVRDKAGNLTEPGSATAIIGGILAAGFGIVWFGLASTMGAPFPFPLFGLVFVAVAILGAVTSANKGSAYETARADYERRRQEVLRELSDAGVQPPGSSNIPPSQ